MNLSQTALRAIFHTFIVIPSTLLFIWIIFSVFYFFRLLLCFLEFHQSFVHFCWIISTSVNFSDIIDQNYNSISLMFDSNSICVCFCEHVLRVILIHFNYYILYFFTPTVSHFLLYHTYLEFLKYFKVWHQGRFEVDDEDFIN